MKFYKRIVMNRKDFLVFVSSFDLPAKKLHKLFGYFTQEEFSFDIVNDKRFITLAGDTYSSKMQKCANMQYLERYREDLFNKSIQLISFEDKEYSDRLKDVSDSPFFLFCKGDVSLLKSRGVAIVGTRSPSNYGKIITEKFARELAQAGLTIISGLAYGIDSFSHRQALDVNGKTIAVLGGGFDKIYPSEHTDLANTIAEKGLLLSEYPPSITPTKFSFPQRNRIVAGLSVGILITEAGEKSGTMITKDFAIDNGINVYAVPGNITSVKSEGTNKLIANSQGICVLSTKDILDNLGIDKKSDDKIIQLNVEEQFVVDALMNGEQDADTLCEKTQLNINKLNSLLVSLEIRGIIRKMSGGRYNLT